MSIQRDNKSLPTTMHILTPDECSTEELASFSRLVRQGNQVMGAGLETRVAEAAYLGFARFNERLVGVGALKVPRPAYQAKVFSAADVVDRIAGFRLELGWVFVLPEFRSLGIAQTLLCKLLAMDRGNGIYATTRADNPVIHGILRHLRFETLGHPFLSSRKEAYNYLWGHRDDSCPPYEA